MSGPVLVATEDVPSTIHILPLRDSVLLPGGVLPLAVRRRQRTIAPGSRELLGGVIAVLEDLAAPLS